MNICCCLFAAMMDSTAHGFRHYMFPDIFSYDQLPEVSIIQLCKFLWSLECFMLQATAEVELLSCLLWFSLHPFCFWSNVCCKTPCFSEMWSHDITINSFLNSIWDCHFSAENWQARHWPAIFVTFILIVVFKFQFTSIMTSMLCNRLASWIPGHELIRRIYFCSAANLRNIRVIWEINATVVFWLSGLSSFICSCYCEKAVPLASFAFFFPMLFICVPFLYH
jgi:hypothetical protein